MEFNMSKEKVDSLKEYVIKMAKKQLHFEQFLYKEYNILQKLISSRGRVYTREQLLDDIWGYDYVGDARNVDSHVARLRSKLGEWGATHLKTIYGIGYKIEVN